LFVTKSGALSFPRNGPYGRRIYDQDQSDAHLWVHDKTTGAMLAEIPIGSNAGGSPMTYMAGGKQFVAFSVGGGNVLEELIALALP
jgi:quinoprotein glucose dehydrogenase